MKGWSLTVPSQEKDCFGKIFPNYGNFNLLFFGCCAKIFKHLKSAGILESLPVGVEPQEDVGFAASERIEADSPLPTGMNV